LGDARRTQVQLTHTSPPDTTATSRHTLEFVLTLVLELDARTSDKIDDCARDQDIAGGC
jgi:hypothetical protein